MTISLDEIQLILQEADVEGLIALGAPSDEYRDEAKEIESRIRQDDNDHFSYAYIESVVAKVWQECFGPFSDSEFALRLPELKVIAGKLAAA